MKYNELYSEYWSCEDRLGESSFHNATQLAQRIVRFTGAKRVLDVGSGMGALVSAFEGVRLILKFSDPSKTVLYWDIPPTEVCYKIVSIPQNTESLSIEINTNAGADNATARGTLLSLKPFTDV